MSNQKLLGVVLLIAGIILAIYFGFESSNASRLSSIRWLGKAPNFEQKANINLVLTIVSSGAALTGLFFLTKKDDK